MLFIDDSIYEYRWLREELRGYTIYWLPDLKQIVEHGVEWFPAVDMVISDYGGVSSQLIDDLLTINHARVVVTSGEPHNIHGFEFVLKKDLPRYIIQRLR